MHNLILSLKEWFTKLSIIKRDLYSKILFVFGLLFIVIVSGLIYYAFKYNISRDEYFTPFILVFLIFLFWTIRLLRVTFEKIRDISTSFTKTAEATTQVNLTSVTDELGGIVQSFRALEDQLQDKVRNLEKKMSEMDTLRDMYDLSYMTLNADYLLFIALERALKLVNADIGSVMMLSDPQKDAFIIKASIGTPDHVKKGTVTPFDDSIAKHTVINKAPLLVEDIEKDPRFGRRSRNIYATKSFICVPLKTSHDIIGVVTISRRRSGMVFTQEDVDLLAPLLSNLAYIYNNINLFKETTDLKRNINLLESAAKTLNSSLKRPEMLQVIFEQMRKSVIFDVIAVLEMTPDASDKLYIVDFKSYIPTNLIRGRRLMYEDSVMQKAIKEQRSVFVPNVTKLSSYIDTKLFGSQNIKTALIMPLKTEGRITGLILMMNLSEEEWKASDHRIDMMGDYLSLVMEKDRMSGLLNQRNRELNILRHIGDALAVSTFEIEKILDHAMEMIRAAIPAEAGYLMLPDRDELYFAAAYHLDMNKLKSITLRKGEGIAGHVFEHGIPVIVDDAKRHEQFSPAVDRQMGFITRTILCVPLISQSQVMGTLTLLNKEDGFFNEPDEKLLQSIASTISIALENARLYQDALAGSEVSSLMDWEN